MAQTSGRPTAPTSSLPPLARLASHPPATITAALDNLRALYFPAPSLPAPSPAKRPRHTIHDASVPDSGYASAEEHEAYDEDEDEVEDEDDDEDDEDEALELLRADPFERGFAIRWLTGLAARADIFLSPSPSPSPARAKAIDAAAALLAAFSGGTEPEQALTRTFAFPSPSFPTSTTSTDTNTSTNTSTSTSTSTSTGTGTVDIALNDAPLSGADHTAVGLQSWASSIVLAERLCADPGAFGLSDVPQFVVFTADDAVQTYTLDAVNQFLAQRKNPNGCPVKMTYYTSLNYTNYTLVTDWYVAGNEIADHTMTHVGSPPDNEIDGNLIALNALAGIPFTEIRGFRAPFLNISVDNFKHLAAAKFTYDSSLTAAVPVTDPNTDAFWPYTLDNGLASNCLDIPNACKGEPKLPGFWEVPMYAFFDNGGVNGPHLMDPWLDNANGQTTVNDSATLEYMKNTFTAHYNGNRQPIGLYTHPIHVSRSVPGSTVTNSTINMINAFLDWAQQQPNVWIVSTGQLLDWVMDPKPVSQLDSSNALKCSTPQVSDKICNGMPANEAGLAQHCAFSDSPFDTCYGCPVSLPTVDNPNPEQSPAPGAQPRVRLPANCSTPFWDPIGGKCLCTDDSCSFTDDSRPVGPNGANLTGGGTGGEAAASTSSAASFQPFNGDGALSNLPVGVFWSAAVGLVGVAFGFFHVLA
ncbi:hypothetical protein OF83DRAFT_1082191 [Amylostereum chailletii]|nr:hypothetical protein OF83DRAFT_1082191 [Amylostereum chailletii]